MRLRRGLVFIVVVTNVADAEVIGRVDRRVSLVSTVRPGEENSELTTNKLWKESGCRETRCEGSRKNGMRNMEKRKGDRKRETPLESVPKDFSFQLIQHDSIQGGEKPPELRSVFIIFNLPCNAPCLTSSRHSIETVNTLKRQTN